MTLHFRQSNSKGTALDHESTPAYVYLREKTEQLGRKVHQILRFISQRQATI